TNFRSGFVVLVSARAVTGGRQLACQVPLDAMTESDAVAIPPRLPVRDQAEALVGAGLLAGAVAGLDVVAALGQDAGRRLVNDAHHVVCDPVEPDISRL